MPDPQQIYQSKLTTNRAGGEPEARHPPPHRHLGVAAARFHPGAQRAQDGPDPLYVTTHLSLEPSTYLDRSSVYASTGFLGPWERAARNGSGNLLYVPVQFTAAADFWAGAARLLRDARRADGRPRPLQHVAQRRLGVPRRALSPPHRPGTRIVFEVCPHLPRVRGLAQFGDNELPLEIADVVVEDSTPPFYLLATPARRRGSRHRRTRRRADRGSRHAAARFGTVPMMVEASCAIAATSASTASSSATPTST